MAGLSNSAKGIIGLVVVPSLAAIVFSLVDRTHAGEPAAAPRVPVTAAGAEPPTAVPGRRKVTMALSQ